MEQKFYLAAEVKRNLLQLIRKTMEKNGISQGEIARRIGSARPNVNKIFREKESATIDFLLKIAESIDLDLELRQRKK